MKGWCELEKQAACQVAALMAVAARTAPKTRGNDNIQVAAIDEESTRQALVSKMKEIARSENRPGFERDANNVAASPGSLLSPPSPQGRGLSTLSLFSPLPWGQGGPLPAFSSAGAGRVRGHSQTASHDVASGATSAVFPSTLDWAPCI